MFTFRSFMDTGMFSQCSGIKCMRWIKILNKIEKHQTDLVGSQKQIKVQVDERKKRDARILK